MILQIITRRKTLSMEVLLKMADNWSKVADILFKGKKICLPRIELC